MRKYGPLKSDSHLIKRGARCIACDKHLKEGDIITLIVIGPGDDTESRERANAGRPYNAIAKPCHWDCADPEYKKDVQ